MKQRRSDAARNAFDHEEVSKGYRIQMTVSPFGWQLQNDAGEVLLRLLPDGFRYGEVHRLSWSRWPMAAWYRFHASPTRWWPRPAIPARVSSQTFSLWKDHVLEFTDGARFSWQQEEMELLTLHFAAPAGISLQGERARLQLCFSTDPAERFYGFGERMNAVDQRGQRVPICVEENGIGLPERWASWVKWPQLRVFPNGPLSTYAPMPFFLSSRGYALWLDNTQQSVFDLRHKQDWSLTAWTGEVTLHVAVGSAPLQLLERVTQHTGRTMVGPYWTFGPWNVTEGGTQRVLQTAQQLREAGIPSTALWIEDWRGIQQTPRGVRNAPFYPQADTALYPSLPQMAASLHRKGFSLLGYYQPFVLEGRSLCEAAAHRGALVLDAAGQQPAFVSLMGHRFANLDLSTEAGRAFSREILAEGIRMGFDGWMADFGEYVPPDARLHDGERGWEAHNQYPLWWAQVNRDALQADPPDQGVVFFMRAAWLGSQRFVPVIWGGDANMSFERYDGLPSQVRAALTAGISGLPLWTTDIAGYMNFGMPPADEELYLRWLAFGALCPVMRDHHGFYVGQAWRWDKTPHTQAVYRWYAALHTALAPWWMQLWHEAADHGWPVLRPLWLHFWEDGVARSIEDTYLIGDRLLAAPVLARGARRRRLYLPEGSWWSLFEGKAYRGPAWVEVPAPLEKIPLFLRGDSLLPLLGGRVDTLRKAYRGTSTATELIKQDTCEPADLIDLIEAMRWFDLMLVPDAVQGTCHLSLESGTQVTLCWRRFQGESALQQEKAATTPAPGSWHPPDSARWAHRQEGAFSPHQWPGWQVIFDGEGCSWTWQTQQKEEQIELRVEGEAPLRLRLWWPCEASQ
ncbi:MAG: hypothetical protein IMW91_00505 [Firmicutes bacterium]|nr:hypothetical protein [Bacillota bacterium]